MRITWIEPDVLAASGIPISADDLQSLVDQGIRAILTLTERPLTVFKGITDDLFRNLDIVNLHVPVPDQYPPDQAQAEIILEFIETMKRQNRPTLVHCHAGIGRTGTVLYLYYLGQGLNLEEATTMIRARRPQNTLLTDPQMAFLNVFKRH